MPDGLVILHHSEQAGTGFSRTAERDADLHNAFGAIRIQTGAVTLKRSGLTGFEIHANVIIHRSAVILAHKVFDGILQAEGGNDQHIAADDAGEQYDRSPLVAHQIANDHFAVEGETLPQPRPMFEKNARTALRRLRP